MPHMLVGGSTGSGKSVFLFSMLAALLMTHPKKEDMQLILSSSKLEDFIHFEGLPHLYSGRIISDATKATKVIKEVIFEESERRGRLLAEARVANIVEYNKKVAEKLSHEYKIGNYKADLFIHDTNTLIEIKSTLSFSKESTFPTVYSERAVKQLTEISRLLDEGYRACYILVSLNPSVKEITINSEIEDYYKEFMKCIEKGMTYCAFSIRLHEQTPELYAKIKITI